MIALFTDFGADDVYVGQLKAALHQCLTLSVTIVDLLHNAPSFEARLSAHLLDALQRRFPKGTVFLTVIDPGVGSDRDSVVLQADDKWYVGPDNGLLSVVRARAVQARVWRIVWRPSELSASFHARDLFAHIVADIAAGEFPFEKVEERRELQVKFGPEDLGEVIYIDHYGNAMTGLRACMVSCTAAITVRGQQLRYARIFADAPEGAAFWYENSIGLIELAADRASAAAQLGLDVGDAVAVVDAGAR